jgi:hypothetical protein
MEAMAVLRVGEKAWVEELVAMTKSTDPEQRNLALATLGATMDPAFLEPLTKALDDPNWSTRLAALEALERMRTKDALGAIIARMSKEDGRLQHEFSLTLFRLTGQPFEDKADAWSSWWATSKDKFTFPSAVEVAKIKTGEDEWLLRQSTHVKAEFFGIKLYSHRVIFIIDISGSMQEGLLNPYEGKSDATRIDVAKGELLKCVTALDTGAFFNILIFSSGVEKWNKGSLAAANEKNREEAKSFIEKLAPFGGTNLYDAVKLAFEDPDVDTIFIMSDGEPNLSISDPTEIREHVKAWNEHRGIVINTIGLAGQFQILEWLAEDSGGTHVKYE